MLSPMSEGKFTKILILFKSVQTIDMDDLIFCSGLFHSVISQSGTALTPWSLTRNPKEQAERFASGLNCPTDNTKAMADCLKKLPVDAILDYYIEARVGLICHNKNSIAICHKSSALYSNCGH